MSSSNSIGRGLPSWLLSLALTVIGVLAMPAVAAAACPWGYTQTLSLQNDPWESLKLVEDAEGFDRKALEPNCRKTVAYLQGKANDFLAKNAAFLHVALRTSTETSSQALQLLLNEEPVGPLVSRLPAGRPLKPGRYSFRVDAPTSSDGRVPLVRVTFDGVELTPDAESKMRYQLELTKGSKHELSVKLAFVEAKCYLLEVNRQIESNLGDPALSLTLHGLGSSIPLDPGGNRLAAYRYALELGLDEATRERAGTRVLLNGHAVEERVIADGSKRYLLSLDCSPTQPRRGSLLVEVGEMSADEAPEAPALRRRKLPTLFWVSAGTGVAGLAGAAIAFWGIHQPKENEALALFNDRGCSTVAASCDLGTQAKIEDLYDASDGAKAISIVSLGVGVAGTALAGILYFTASNAKPEPEAKQAQRGLLLEPIVSATGYGATLSGAF